MEKFTPAQEMKDILNTVTNCADEHCDQIVNVKHSALYSTKYELPVYQRAAQRFTFYPIIHYQINQFKRQGSGEIIAACESDVMVIVSL